jgi:hypothetical protein
MPLTDADETFTRRYFVVHEPTGEALHVRLLIQPRPGIPAAPSYPAHRGIGDGALLRVKLDPRIADLYIDRLRSEATSRCDGPVHC